MSQIFLFTGENSFTLREEVRRWIGSFRDKHGEENLMRITARNLTARALFDEVAVAPFIAENRLVIVEGIPSLSKEEVLLLANEMHPQVVILFIEPKPDKRLSATKELLKLADVKEFNSVAGAGLKAWMKEFLKQRQAQIEPDACDALLEMVGTDQGMLAEELKKLALFAHDRPIRSADAFHMVIPTGEQVVWHLMDLLGAGKKEEALCYARDLLDRGESPHGLWSRLLWMVNNLVLVSAALADGQTNPQSIAKNTGVNFMSVRSLLPLARQLDPKRLQEFVDDVAESDVGLKTGAYRATGEAPQELTALIDRLILHIA